MKPEQIEQCKLFDWIRSRQDIKPYAFHIANERQTTPQQGRILKRMGVRSGVSDIFIGLAKGRWHGLFLELKAGNNTPTESQEQFMYDMASQGYYCIWCSGYEHARKSIEIYLALEIPSSESSIPPHPTSISNDWAV